MPNDAVIIPEIPDLWLQEESPWSEELMGRFRDGLKWLHGAIAGKETSTLLQQGTVDSDPVDGASTSTFTDSNPTSFTSFANWGHLYVPDLFEGLYLEMTNGPASGDRFRITEHDLGTSPTDTTESNFTVDGLMDAAGVVAGNTYKIIGHAHNGVFDEKIDLSAADSTRFISSGDYIMMGTPNACPTGFTRITSYDNRLIKVSTGTAGTNGGSSTHTHTGSGNSGNISAGSGQRSMAPLVNGIFTNVDGSHTHPMSGTSASGNSERLERGIFICQKD